MTTNKTRKKNVDPFTKKVLIFIKNLLPSASEIKSEKNSFIFSIISGILYVLLFPKPSINFLAWIALVPLLLSTKNKSYKMSFWLGIIFGIVAFYGSLFWINFIRKYNPFAVLGIPFIAFYLSIYTGLFSMGYNFFERNYKKTGFLFSALLFPGLEYIRSVGTFAFPFNYLAASQVNSIPLIQICDITGVFGVSFIVVLINIFIADTIYSFKKKDLKRIPFKIAIVSGCLIFSFVYGYFRLKTNFVDKAQKIKIGIVQPSIPQEIKLQSYADENEEVRNKLQIEINEKQFILLNSNKNKSINLFILPETAFTNEMFTSDFNFHIKLQNMAKDIKADLFFGADRYVLLDRKGKITNNKDEYAGVGAYNSAWYLDKDEGLRLESYEKMHLLPFGEYVPYFDKIPFFQELIVQVGSFLKGTKYTIFKSDSMKFGCVICFESVLGNLVRQFRNRGADFLVVITNDGWYEDTAGPLQHADFCVFRAIENRTWLVRSANHGISGFITPYGEWKSRTKINEITVVSEEISPALETKTFYSKFGDVFAVSSLLICLIFFLNIIRNKKIHD